MRSINNIIRGHAKELVGINQPLADYRLSICKGCPLYIDTAIGVLCNRYLYLNKDTNETSRLPKEGYIRGCGCRLDAKTRNEDDSCVADKW